MNRYTGSVNRGDVYKHPTGNDYWVFEERDDGRILLHTMEGGPSRIATEEQLRQGYVLVHRNETGTPIWTAEDGTIPLPRFDLLTESTRRALGLA